MCGNWKTRYMLEMLVRELVMQNVTGCFVLHIQLNELVKVVFKYNTVVVLT